MGTRYRLLRTRTHTENALINCFIDIDLRLYMPVSICARMFVISFVLVWWSEVRVRACKSAFPMWCILVLDRRAGSPLMMTRLRVVARKQFSASVPLDPLLLLLFSASLLSLISDFNTPVSVFPPCRDHYHPPFLTRSPLFASHRLPFFPTSLALTFWLAGLVGRTARWLYLFVWIADGPASWLLVEFSALPVPHVVHLFIYPLYMLPVFHPVFFVLFCFVCDTCASLQSPAKTPLFAELKKKALSVCTFSPFLLLFFLAHRWLCQSRGAGSTLGVNCLIARDGRDPHLLGVGLCVWSVKICVHALYVTTQGLWGSVMFLSVGSDKCFVYLASGRPYLVGLIEPD